MSVPEYTTGTWTAVVRPGFVALLGPGAAESTVRALWQDAGEGVFAALALLARDGFGGLPPFAVVSVDGQRVHAALRGDVEVVVEVGGRQDVWRSGEVSTWTERVLEGVADVAVQVEDAAIAGDSLPLADGVVRASRVRVGLTARTEVVAREAHPETGPAAVVEQAPVEPTVVEADTEAPVADEPTVVPEPAVAEPVAEQAPDLDPVVAEGDEVGTALDAEGPVTEIIDAVVWDEPTQVELVPLTRQGEDHTDPAGVVAEAESFLSTPAPPRTTSTDGSALPVAVGAASLDDHDGLTILSTDLAEIRDQLPSWASDEVPGPFRVPEVASVAARLVLSTGLVVPLDRAVLLGRAPQVARVTNRELPRLITVPSPQQDISRTHAEVRLDGDHVVVTDLDSTNGVHVARAGEGARRLHPGEPSVVGVDEVVDLGDGVTFSVERGS
ncbi:FHA domain-containing protein [Cellulomonas sp.]|uniref:FHA domain-containing protein n=1 Tax=Cellulomonas sp. TaxID=40001 RepID=UPI003BA869DC